MQERISLVETFQLRDSTGAKIDPAVKEKQNQQDTHWEFHSTSSGVGKAEVNGQVVIVTDIIVTSVGANGYGIIKRGGSAGAQIFILRCLQNSGEGHSFREGLEAAAFDGSNGGDIYVQVSNANVTVVGYTRDA